MQKELERIANYCLEMDCWQAISSGGYQSVMVGFSVELIMLYDILSGIPD